MLPKSPPGPSLRAAPDTPREIWLGRATIEAILGTILLPGLLDRIMARRAYDAQMGEPETMPNRRNNLYEPVDGLHRTAGRFTERALDSTPGLRPVTDGLRCRRSDHAGCTGMTKPRNEAGPRPAGAGQGPAFDSRALKTGNR